MGGRMTTTTKLDRAINFLCLLHPLITRSEGEIINSDNNINTNNSNDYNIYNDRQSYNITTTTTISIPSTKQAEQLLQPPFAKRILIIDDDPDITLTFKKGLEA
jgi:hypothetical protein